ncbi:MAG: lycopene cyclase family protein [Ginsengibacter sp.]
MSLDSSIQYDFIFAGTGCASLSIVMRMIDSGKFADKKILLIDKNLKNRNDRTWCFWEKENGYFENIVHKKWDDLLFKTNELSISLEIDPYQYKMIRGIDFYNYCFSKIRLQPNIEIKPGEISFKEKEIKINDELLPVNNAIVFNSILNTSKKPQDKFYLLQHFKGWIIETPSDQFNHHQGTLMDFGVSQNSGTAFIYVLPLAPNKALVEYTLFTESLLQKEEYDLQLTQYIKHHLNIGDFKLIEEEFGVIPMTNEDFAPNENGMFNIGTAGGQTKPSTGYTFQFIQKQAQQIVQELITNGHPSKKINLKKRFHFYDSTLLHILSKNKLQGKEVFTHLFKKNKAAKVFKFLDNETTLKEELKIISSLPTKEFLVAGVKELIKML